MHLNELEYTTLLRSNPDLAGPQLPKLPRGLGKAPSEQAEQEAVIAWAAANEGRWPELKWLFHIPNGGERPAGAGEMLRRAGVKAGVPDLHLPVARAGANGRTIHGLWIEVKKRDHSNSPSPDQRAWIEALRGLGHMAIVAFGADEAIAHIEHYLNLNGE